MKGYFKKIEEYVNKLPEGTIFEASGLYRSEFPDISEASYYKTLERLSRSGVLNHFSKGVYSVPKNSSFGCVPVSNGEIVEYFTKNNKGVIVGYRLYLEKGITTQVSGSIDVLSTVLEGNRKTIKNVRIRKSDVELNDRTVPIIETLEILQNYHSLEDASSSSLYRYMKQFSKEYSDSETMEVLSRTRYKKSTIAFLKNFLDAFDVPNSLGLKLSSLSKYAVPGREEIYEFA